MGSEQDNIGMILITVFIVLVSIVTINSFPEQIELLVNVFTTIMTGGAPV